ncbi:hypothetical protein NQ315_010185 [Exocentrus adspersus]|uniref:Uncharacterized protein n=1 Tax=Exocentrus adspersus TaxID=1586481 RepID=A0AAV8WD21_9CUCU|nr:hypothetical protein NQ315_010185 [Exocentrus adspersus]
MESLQEIGRHGPVCGIAIFVPLETLPVLTAPPMSPKEEQQTVLLLDNLKVIVIPERNSLLEYYFLVN